MSFAVSLQKEDNFNNLFYFYGLICKLFFFFFRKIASEKWYKKPV